MTTAMDKLMDGYRDVEAMLQRDHRHRNSKDRDIQELVNVLGRATLVVDS